MVVCGEALARQFEFYAFCMLLWTKGVKKEIPSCVCMCICTWSTDDIKSILSHFFQHYNYEHKTGLE